MEEGTGAEDQEVLEEDAVEAEEGHDGLGWIRHEVSQLAGSLQDDYVAEDDDVGDEGARWSALARVHASVGRRGQAVEAGLIANQRAFL